MSDEVGAIVHFVYGGDHVPAIITGACLAPELAGHVFLTVFLPNAQPFTTTAAYSAEIAPNTWPNATYHGMYH